MSNRDVAPLGRRRVLAALGTAAFAGCFSDIPQNDSSTPVPDPDDHPTPTGKVDWEVPSGSPRDVDIEVEPLVDNLEIPWDLAFTGDELFVTERTGTVLRFDSGDVARVTSPVEAIDASARARVDSSRPPDGWVGARRGRRLR